MKKYLLGILTLFIINFGSRFIWYYGLDKNNMTLVDRGFYLSNIVQGTPVIEIITGRCRSDDKEGNRRTFFECNKVQIFLSDSLYGDKQ